MNSIRDKIAEIIMGASNYQKMALPHHCTFTPSMFSDYADAILAIEHPSKEIMGDICPQHDLVGNQCDGICGEYYNDCHRMRPATLADWSADETG